MSSAYKSVQIFRREEPVKMLFWAILYSNDFAKSMRVLAWDFVVGLL